MTSGFTVIIQYRYNGEILNYSTGFIYYKASTAVLYFKMLKSKPFDKVLATFSVRKK